MKLIITEEVQNRFADMVINFARKEGLTISNINECIKKVEVYMQDNATINCDSNTAQEVPVQEQQLNVTISATNNFDIEKYAEKVRQ